MKTAHASCSGKAVQRNGASIPRSPESDSGIIKCVYALFHFAISRKIPDRIQQQYVFGPENNYSITILSDCGTINNSSKKAGGVTREWMGGGGAMSAQIS